jgi:DNA processing protein
MTLLGLGRIGRHKAEFICTHNSLAIIEAGLVALADKGLLPESVTQTAIEQAVRGAAASISLCHKHGWQIVNKLDPGFPKRLRQISDPPVLLYCHGDTTGLNAFPCVAVIGARAPSSAAEATAYFLGQQLAKLRAAVVSGLALGCDAAAHRGCMDQGGYTAAVLPSGLDTIYPPKNRDLAAQISATGCLLSEYPPGIQPARYRFVERDRLQSGLSDVVIVVESEIHGGAMHTARFAKRQGRRVLVFSPAGLNGSQQASGNQKLLAAGAEAVASVEEVIEIIRALRPGQKEAGTLF